MRAFSSGAVGLWSRVSGTVSYPCDRIELIVAWMFKFLGAQKVISHSQTLISSISEEHVLEMVSHF